MKIEVEKKELIRGMERAGAVVEARSTLPVLTYARIEADKHLGIMVYSTDLDIYQTIRVEGTILSKGSELDTGSVLLPVKKLLKVVKAFDGDIVTIEKVDNRKTQLSCGFTKFTVEGRDIDDYPAQPEKHLTPYCSIYSDILKDLIDKVLYAVSSDQSRPTLNSVLFEVEGSTLRLVATDGSRLAMAEVTRSDLKEEKGPYQRLIPPKALKILKSYAKEGQSIEIGVGEQSICFKMTKEVFLYVRLVEGPLP